MPHARCSYCQKRRTLTKQPAEYATLPKCASPGCDLQRKRKGKPRSYYLDHHRRTKERGKAAPKPCHPGRGGCDGYPFPHRRGSLHCIHNPSRPQDTEFGR